MHHFTTKLIKMNSTGAIAMVIKSIQLLWQKKNQPLCCYGSKGLSVIAMMMEKLALLPYHRVAVKLILTGEGQLRDE